VQEFWIKYPVSILILQADVISALWWSFLHMFGFYIWMNAWELFTRLLTSCQGLIVYFEPLPCISRLCTSSWSSLMLGH
jgi:hypothetical protein